MSPVLAENVSVVGGVYLTAGMAAEVGSSLQFEFAVVGVELAEGKRQFPDTRLLATSRGGSCSDIRERRISCSIFSSNFVFVGRSGS